MPEKNCLAGLLSGVSQAFWGLRGGDVSLSPFFIGKYCIFFYDLISYIKRKIRWEQISMLTPKGARSREGLVISQFARLSDGLEKTRIK